MIITILSFIFALGIIISIHELGHLIFAKKADILCHEYSIGMGPLIFGKRKKETMISLRAIPIGGYVSMAGEEVNNSLITKDQKIGIKLENNKIKYIYLDNLDKADIIGTVEGFDLYNKDETGLFINLNVDGNIQSYDCLENAFYKYGKKKENEMQIMPYKRCFESKKPFQKFLTIIMGPMFNFLLALVLYMIVALFSGVPVEKAIVGKKVEDNYGNVKLMKNDEIIGLTIGNNKYEIETWEDYREHINEFINSNEENVNLTVLRDNKEINVSLNPTIVIYNIQIQSYNYNLDEVNVSVIGTEEFENGVTITKIIDLKDDIVYNNISWDILVNEIFSNTDEREFKFHYMDGNEEKTLTTKTYAKDVLDIKGITSNAAVSLGITSKTKFSFTYFITSGFTEIYDNTKEVFQTLGLLFTGKVSLRDLSGPVGIASATGKVAHEGFLALLAFTAFLSVNIGIVNLLPIPALDGGRLLFVLYEAITKKQPNKKVENTLITIVFVLLMVLFVFVTFNDILRLF